MPDGGTPPFPWHLTFFEKVRQASRCESIAEISIAVMQALEEHLDDYEAEKDALELIS